MTTFEEYKDYIEKARVTEQSLQVYNASTDPNAKVNSRKNLEAIINSTIQHANVNANTPDNTLNELGLKVRDRYQRLATEKFSEAPYESIREAKTKHKDNFKERYLAISPFNIKNNEEHNEIAKLHKNFKELLSIVETFRQDSTSRKYNEFIKSTLPYLEEDIKAILGKDPEKITELITEVYETSSPNEALNIINYTLHSMSQRLESLLPEDRREDYVERTLKAKVGVGEKEIGNAASELYRLVA